MSVMRTLAPSLAKRMEVSRPIPLQRTDDNVRGLELARKRGVAKISLPSSAGNDSVLASKTAAGLGSGSHWD